MDQKGYTIATVKYARHYRSSYRKEDYRQKMTLTPLFSAGQKWDIFFLSLIAPLYSPAVFSIKKVS